MGLPEAIIPQNAGVDRSFGVAMHPNGALLRGMLDKTKNEVTGGLEMEQGHLLKAIDEQQEPATPSLESATDDKQDSPSGNERKD